MSVTASASASPTKSRSGEATGQARRAAILETGTGRGLWALACEGRGAALGTAPPYRHLGGQQVSLSAPASVGPNFLSRSRRPTPSRPDRTQAVQPQPVTAAPRRRRRREAGPGPAARTYDGGSRFAEVVTAITWRQGGLAAQPPWGVGGAGRNCGALGEVRPLLQGGN